MSVLIRGGTVVTADHSFRADVLCRGQTIAAVEADIEAPPDATVVDAGGLLVMPGGIDTHTHLEAPIMGTVTADDFFSGTAAAAAGGTTTIIDHVIPEKDASLNAAFEAWRERARKAAGDYAFHVAVTWWNDAVAAEMRTLARDHGVNSFKHFMAYKNEVMVDDAELLQSFLVCAEVGAVPTVHTENGEILHHLQRRLLAAGLTGPEGHVASHPPEIEAEAAHRAVAFARAAGVPVYIVHVSSRDALEVIVRAREAGQRVYAECIAGHLVVDDTVYETSDWAEAAAHVMSPPYRPADHIAYLWRGLQSGAVDTTASDHCVFRSHQKAMGRNDFTNIPNGANGLEDRMSVLWHFGVERGYLTPSEFVRATSANAARIFNIYPKKGAVAPGADADIVVWDPAGTRTISAETHRQGVDFNVFEGLTVTGVPAWTLSRGRIVYAHGDLRAERGWGQYVARPCFPPVYDAVRRRRAEDDLLLAKRRIC